MQTDHHMARMSHALQPQPLSTEERGVLLGVLRDVERVGVETGTWEQGKVLAAVADIVADRDARLEALADEWERLGLPTAAGELRAAFRAALHPVQGDELIQEPPC